MPNFWAPGGELLVSGMVIKPLWKALNNSPFDPGCEAPPRENMDAQLGQQRPHTPRKRPGRMVEGMR